MVRNSRIPNLIFPPIPESNMAVHSVGVVGSGQMGNGIAQVAAISGKEVIMVDIKEEFLESASWLIAR